MANKRRILLPFSTYLSRLFVLPEHDETRVPQMVFRRPLDELELPNELDAAWNKVSGVTAAPPIEVTPTPRAHATFPA